LLNIVNVEGALVSVDALFCYQSDLQIILDTGADYLVGLKGNQPKLEDEVFHYFDQAKLCNYGGTENMSLLRRLAVNIVRTVDPGRGLAEARRAATYQPNYLFGLLSRTFVQ
jgi:predicted transposase YbfD/YdcC